MEILDWLYKNDRESLGEDICNEGHHFPKGKYDFCPICLRKFKSESDEVEEPTDKIDLAQEQDLIEYYNAIEAAKQYLNVRK